MGLFQFNLCKYMKGVLNGKLVDVNKLPLQLLERGFNYGDGLFETIIVKNTIPRFLDFHISRLKKGMQALSMEDSLQESSLIKYINLLIEIGNLKDTGRIKLLVWRSSGGLYTPETTSTEMLLFTAPNTRRESIIHNSDIAKKINLHHSPISEFKTISALPYVLAGIEKKERKLDEIILLDNFQNISECSSSNLFWIKNDIFYTPSLNTGCIAGVMRRHILHQARLSGRQIFEVMEQASALATADQVFCCNVTGVYVFENFRGKKYNLNLDPDVAKWVNE